jgi:hypothetical protein
VSGDFVAFEPNSLQRLSSNLDALAQTLEGNLSKISTTISAANGHVKGSGQVAFWASKARSDANDMASRSRRAWELVRQGQAYKPPNFSGPIFSPGMVNIDWSATSQSGQQAQQDARDLNLGKKATREQLAAAARSVANHKADKAYLSTFWGSVDPRVAAELARILHEQDSAQGKQGRPLSEGSKRILADLASGMAAASRSGLLPASVENALEKPPGNDMWSPAMLFKYGPNGSQYDAAFLKAMGASVLDWRRKYGQMPSFDTRTQKWSAPDGAWYMSLGAVHGLGGQIEWPDGWNKAIGAIADNDPAGSILNRVAQNGKASRDLMQDKQYAKDIVNPNWVVPRYGGLGKAADISGAPGRVVVAATANRDKFPTETANAALNAFLAIAALRKGAGKIDDTKGNLALNDELPGDLTRAVAVMGTQYISDLLSAADGNPGSTGLDDDHRRIALNDVDLKIYLSVLAKDPTALGIFRGGIDSETAHAASEDLLKGVKASDDSRLLGKLGGLAALAAANSSYEQAEKADMAAARKLQLLTTVVGVGTGVPLPKMPDQTSDAVSWLKFLTSQTSGRAGSLFDTGHAAEAQMANEDRYESVLAQAKLPVAQGIYAAWMQGKLKLPPGHEIPRELMQGDHLVLRDDVAVTRFNIWFTDLPKNLRTPYTDFEDGFNHATEKRRDQWKK